MGSSKYYKKWDIFLSSYMVGSGRKFEEQGFLNKLDEIRGYALSDVQRFPDVPYWIIPKGIVKNWWEKRLLGSATKISRKKALELIQGME